MPSHFEGFRETCQSKQNEPDPPSGEETDAINDFLAEFGAVYRDDYWLTEDKGGAEVSYEIDGDQ
jgi:hypothetical protein